MATLPANWRSELSKQTRGKTARWVIKIIGTTLRYDTGYAATRRNKMAAEAFHEDWKATQRRGGQPSIREIIDKYLNDKSARRTASIQNIRSDCKRVVASLGDLTPDQITREVCRLYAKDRRSEGVGAWQIRGELARLRAACNWCGYKNITVELPEAPPPHQHKKALSQADLAALLQATAALQKRYPYIHIYTLLACTTGARRSAITELTWDRVDLDKRMLYLRVTDQRTPKGRPAALPIHDDVYDALCAAYEARKTPWVVEFRGDRVRDPGKAFEQAVQLARIPRITPAILRHTAARRLRDLGVSYEDIARMLGHTSPKITERIYAPDGGESLRSVVNQLQIAPALRPPHLPIATSPRTLPRVEGRFERRFKNGAKSA